MAMVRYSDDDRERMRQEDEAIRQFRRREHLYFQFLRETGRLRIADRTQIAPPWPERFSRPRIDPRWLDEIGRLRIDPTSRRDPEQP